MPQTVSASFRGVALKKMSKRGVGQVSALIEEAPLLGAQRAG